MSVVQNIIQCPQCGFDSADSGFDCRTNEVDIGCRKCGYTEVEERVEDGDGQVTWRHCVREGSGVLFYRPHDGFAFAVHYLSSEEGVLNAEGWLRKELASRRVIADSAYLTRWNREKRCIDFVIGAFYEYPGDSTQADATEPNKKTDLFPF